MSVDEGSKKTRIRITLRAARISSGYSANEVAKRLNISPETLFEYEWDAGEMPLGAAIKILRLYRFSADIIHFGNESEFIKSKNRN